MRPFQTSCSRWSVATGLLALVAVAPVAAADKTEEYPSGKARIKYKVNDDGVKEGPFTEFYENGKVRAKGTYKAGQLHGAHTAYYPTGIVMASANYVAGALDGKYGENDPKGARRLTATYKDGALKNLQMIAGGKYVADQNFDGGDRVPPRRLAEIQLALATIATTPSALKPTNAERDREAGLRRLMSYRAACGVPYDEMTLDKEMNAQAEAGAELCQALGRLDHTPQNTVGWSDDKFNLAYKGTSQSNLHMNSLGATSAGSVDGYMDDSDPSNIDRVGHRLWCLNPAMQKTGFGLSSKGTYAAMWAFDRSRKPIPDYEYVAYPPAGFASIGYFGPRHAWSFSPNPAKYRLPDKNAVTVKLFQKTDKTADKPGTEVKLDYTNSSTFIRPTAIFRPQALNLTEGSRYVVEVTGFETRDGKPVTFTYLVIFVTTY